MSITDELREWFSDRLFMGNGYAELVAIADRIDVEHDRALVKAIAEAQAEEAELCQAEVAHGWVKLPVDADGVPINVGDELTNDTDLPAKVRCMVLDESGWMVSTRELRGYGVLPATLRHVQPDSWVRIIGDAMSFEGDGWYSTRDDAMAELVERCRRLAGEAE